MTELKIVCTGADAGGWEALARACFAPGTISCLALKDLGSAPPQARLVGFVEQPAAAVAQALAKAPDADPVTLVDAWSRSAQQLLRLRQSQPERCLLLEASELGTAPQAAARVLAAHVGPDTVVAAPQAGTAEAGDLLMAVAEAAVVRVRRVVAQYAELRAACQPLVDIDAAVEPGADLGAAVSRWAELEQLAAQAPRSLERAEQLRGLAQAQSRECDRLRAELASAQQDAALALQQLHQTQATLERELVRHGDEQRALAEQKARELARLANEHRAALDKAQVELQAALAERDRLQPELDRARASERELTTAQGLLQDQLHQVQEELERYFIENERLASGATSGVAAGFVVERAQFGPARDEAPHRELPFLLNGVQAGERAWPTLSLRLLEHHGRAGLALFAAADGPAPLSAWQPSGQEDGRAYMLLIPSDANTRPGFDALTRSDWVLLNSLAAWLGQALAQSADPAVMPWCGSAGRLALQIAALPARWRFDAATLSPSEGGVVRLAFDGVDVAGRSFEQAELLWSTGRAGSAGWIDFVLPADGRPLLAAWPCDDTGRLAPRWRLRLGAAVPAEQTRADWRALGPTDQAVLRAALDALPAALARAEGAAPDDQGLAGVAQTLPGRLERVLRRSRLKRVARALLGRDAA